MPESTEGVAGKEQHCEFDGVETVLKADGRYCCVPVTHKVTLGEIVDLLQEFKAQPTTLLYSCHPRSKHRLEKSGFQLDPRVRVNEPLGFNDYNKLQMNALAIVSDSGTLPEESSFYLSIGHPIAAVCIRTSTERPEALEAGDFILAGIKSVFDALGADTYVINAQPNGTNINNNAGSTHIEGLQKFVVEKGLDIGFAYDGDADRCLCVDEKGNVITGDHILYIYGCYMKERGKLLTNTVVTTVMSNFGLYKAFDEKGIGYAKTAVGDKYVYEYMAKNGCRIGGEQSGHIIFSKYASTGDGILTSLKMMEVMLAKKLPMSKLAEPLKIYPQVLENVRVTDKKAAQDDEAVQAAVKAVAEALGDTGRILVRESGTEPVVRVMVEAPDHDTCQKYVSQVVETIKSKGYAV